MDTCIFANPMKQKERLVPGEPQVSVAYEPVTTRRLLPMVEWVELHKDKKLAEEFLLRLFPVKLIADHSQI